MTLPDSVRDQLAEVFDTKQAVVLANVVTDVHDTFATKSDMQELRAVVRDIAEFQKAADARQARTDARIDRMTESIDQLTGQVRQLTVGQEQLFASEERLTEKMRQLAIGQDDLVGPVYEGKVAAHLYAYVGDTVDHCVVLDSRGKARFFARLDPARTLEPSEISDLRRADMFATGRIGGEEVVLVVEVSRTGDEYDINRTARRAAILAKTGRRAIPILACLRIDSEATDLARERGVWVIRRGRLFNAET